MKSPMSWLVHPLALLPLAGAFTYAAGALLTRMARTDSVATSVMWSAVVGSALTSLAVPFVWQPIVPSDLWAFALLGVCFVWKSLPETKGRAMA